MKKRIVHFYLLGLDEELFLGLLPPEDGEGDDLGV